MDDPTTPDAADVSASRAPSSVEPIRVGILVVYYLRSDDDLDLLRIHLERIRRHTRIDYQIFATANRVSDEVRALLAAEPHLVLVSVPATGDRGSREHGYYLDALIPVAIGAGCTHLCTLDVDSFPIDDRWIDTLVAASEPSGFAGVLRRENGDTELPHPSCTFATRAFVEHYAPSYSPDLPANPPTRRFQRQTGQPSDTGIRIGAALWTAGVPWVHLERTNAHDPHYLMAGIYGDAVFHLGSAGRGKLFRHDVQSSRAHRATRPLERMPVPASLARARRNMVRRLRRGAERRISARNREVYALLREWLVTDGDGLVDYLRGNASPAPAWQARLAPAVGGNVS